MAEAASDDSLSGIAAIRLSDLNMLTATAGRSVRKRQHLNLHNDYSEPSQRLLNAVQRHSYIRPHRHDSGQGPETLLGLRGTFVLLIFDDAGAVTTRLRFGEREDTLAVCIPTDVWHTVVSLEDEAVLFEIKNGPFDPAAAKRYPSWAPEEGSQMAMPYLDHLSRIALQPSGPPRDGD